MIRILAFLETPASGRAIYGGQPFSQIPLDRRRQVTMLNQEPYLPKRSVQANVAYGMRRGVSHSRHQMNRALLKVGLDPARFSHRSWRELSGGEAQRVALATRLMLEPKVLLLDEPTASVDRESSELILKAAMDARNRWGTTLIVISHQINWLQQIADRILAMDYGHLTPLN